MKEYTKYYFISLIALSLLPVIADAQNTPNSVSPSFIQEHFNNKLPEPEKPLAPFFPELNQNPVSVTGQGTTFILHDVKIEDSTVYPTGTFKALYAGAINKPLSLSDAQEIANKITARYRNDGYVLSQAVIPVQNLNNGTLRIRIVEGFIDKIIIENDNPNRDRRHLIEAYAEKIKNERPANIHTIERYMLLINDLPGVNAKSIIRASSDTPGAADLIISVKNKAVDANVTSDNRGNKYLGPYQEQMSLSENSIAGLGERTLFSFINTLPESEMHYWSLQHEEQIGTEGTKLVLFASSVKTHPGDVLAPLDIKGLSEDFSATIQHPFLRSRTDNFTGRIVFDAHNTENDALGDTLSADRVRAARIGASYNTTDRWSGVNLADFSFSKGLAWPGATDDGDGRTRTVGEQEFSKANLNLTRLQDLPYNFSLLTTAEGQFTNDALLQSEQMTLGGTGFGSAYDAGEIAGDSGIAGKAELRYNHNINSQWINSFQLYGYYDVGALHVNEVAAGGDSQMSLASAGGGIRFNLVHNIYGYTEVAVPLTKDIASEGNKDPRIFFSLSAQF